ncbi:Capsule assembly protein Wzi [Pedobacter suwonensis]|uniref:Capsule assembly protein Wzi n=2 Tax=Pedobacter suwonensis TaxID=332999 RepID=A0A1I0SRQ4_9SPHI|nr:Capsule assembly protein Wzi [Pedobacter suwonensis]
MAVGTQTVAQTVPVGLLDHLEDNLRRQQLLGNDTSGSSFMIRPLTISARNNVLLDATDGIELDKFRKKVLSTPNNIFSLYVLPITWQQQVNTDHPYGWNDGSMIPARGYQTQISAGFFAKLGPLSVQLKPEYVYAQNKAFTELYQADNEPAFLKKYAQMANMIDNPDRFGTGSYSKVSWGQSNVRLTFDPVSIGLSNENLWWGPGVRNSLLMSNNASGFKHISLNTTRPVNTPIGSFETQIIAGRLESSKIIPDNALFVAKPDDWRYLSGIAFTYQPKWVPNLFLGFDRSFIVYRKDMGSSFGDYFPLFSPVEKASVINGENNEDNRKRDQYASVFARWVMPESHAEVYLQYGRNDHPYNLRDALQEPEHSRAYIAGFRKLIPLKADDAFIQVGVEFTQLEGARTGEARAQPTWYVHHQVKDGYTNMGQVLGAGIGPGSNLQSLELSWVKGLKRIGLQLERLVNNNDLYYFAIATDNRRKWIDLSFSGKFDWTYKSFIVNTQLSYIRSHNYQYTIKGVSPLSEQFWNWDQQDRGNLNLKVGLAYIFQN